MLRFSVAFLTSLVISAAAMAQSVAPIDALYRVLRMTEIIDIMREEGLTYGMEMQDTFLDGRGGARWEAEVGKIYDLAQMEQTVRNRLDEELAAEDLAPMITFFSSPIGQRILRLEESARRAFLDEEIEAASKAAYAEMVRDGHPRVATLQSYLDAGDLIENNVVGALNSNTAFYMGLKDRGALPQEMTEDEILADVWGQEVDIRIDTSTWLKSYLNLAYQPLTDAEFEAYIAFIQSDPGRALNQAIFDAFDTLFVDISYALGQAAGNFVAGEEL